MNKFRNSLLIKLKEKDYYTFQKYKISSTILKKKGKLIKNFKNKIISKIKLLSLFH